MWITQFKEEIATELLQVKEAQHDIVVAHNNRQHTLLDEGRARRCVLCYNKL